MALSSSPRKVIPLAMEDEHVPRPKPRSAGSNLTRRVFFCGVVVEGTEGGRELSQDVQELIASLGDSMDLVPSAQPSQSQDNTDIARAATRRRAMTNTSALTDIIKELVTTERNYVKKLRILKTEYGDPLRTFAREKTTAIIPPYEAKTLFGNIDQLLPVNEAFLADLEKMDENRGPGVGDVALKHFKKLKGFECYRQYYAKHEEVQKLFEREVKKNSRFADYIERVKYSTASDSRNKFGLRELIAEPWQRIPRYTLMFNTMLKHMAMNHPQRPQLEEAIQHASTIARAETDAETKRMAIMHCLSTSIDDFPVNLISNSRHFIDCIDVQDVIAPDPHAPISSNGPAGANTLHCTLFLFDDKLMIVKRPNEKSGRSLAGLDQLDKVVKGGILPSSMRKSGLVCKGVVDITDVAATDVGGADFHVFLENALLDQGERWGGRQFRSLSVVFPPAAVYLDPPRTESEKHRFLENLWTAQARLRTRAERSIVLRGEEREVENRSGYTTFARTYFNVYTRMAFLQEPKKTKIVMHIDQEGVADAIPFGDIEGPYVIVRVQPMAGELARYNVTSSYEDEPEEDIMQTARIPERIVQTIHQYGLFKFQTNGVSRPTTPTASRSRAAIFGLDVISRNLFGARPGSSMGDFFGGSMSGHRRSRTTDSRTTDSRNSTLTGTVSTGGSSFSRFSRTSSSTAATSIMDDDPGQSASMSKGSRNSRTRSLSVGAKKLVKRAKSPFMGDSDQDGGSDDDGSSPYASASGPHSRTTSHETYERTRTFSTGAITVDNSERDLLMRLALARKNSQNQHGHEYQSAIDEPMEETIYEDEPPAPIRPLSRMSNLSRALPELPDPDDYESYGSTSTRSDTPTIRAKSPPLSPESHERPLSRNSSDMSDRRPMGPRSPSPLPPASPNHAASQLPTLDTELEMTLVNAPSPSTPARPIHQTYRKTPIPRSKRQPFEPTTVLSTDTTPRASSESADSVRPPSIIEPLSIKKRSSVRTNSSIPQLSGGFGSPGPGPLIRRPSTIGKSAFAGVTRRVSGQRTTKPLKVDEDVDVDELMRSAEATRADIESAHRVVRKIRLETQKATTSSPVRAAVANWETGGGSPVKRIHPRPASPAVTKEAQARREEMLQLIGRRSTDSSGTRPRVHTMFETSTSTSSLLSAGSSRSLQADDLTRTVDGLAEDADQLLDQALRTQDNVVADIKLLAQLLRLRTEELVKANLGVQNWKRQYEAVSELRNNSQQEVDELYQYFNEELDAMFDDANLPDDDAWAAMTKRTTQAQQAKATIEHENSKLKNRIAELEIQQEQWGTLLRDHGLIP
ncbi:hypothetical protein OH76DRAFT_1342147 [Lentinus brumalis]|uniref:DH domain-containing protein n=1 Tax=Lentinus brumalis TaxID=2498619 RepID=A0A371DMN6_9APHY|nr:hypothetical protein OH76DRAFT_1342147 [Polyporus brumalis]